MRREMKTTRRRTSKRSSWEKQETLWGNSVKDILEKLKTGIKGESSQSVTTKLLALKQQSRNVVRYAADIEDLMAKLKQAYITEGVPSQLAETYTTDLTVKALANNAISDKAKIVMEARTFKTTQEALTKFVGISPEETGEANVLFTRGNYKGQNFRGYNNRNNNYRGNNGFRGRNRGYYNNYNGNNYPNNFNNRGGMRRPNGNNQYRGNNRGNSRGQTDHWVRTTSADDDNNQGNSSAPHVGPLGEL